MTTRTTPPAAAGSIRDSCDFSLEVFRQSDQVGFGQRSVSESLLEPLREQVLFEGQRRGALGPDACTSMVRHEPLFEPGQTSEIRGVRFSVGHGADELSREFDTGVFQPLADKMTLELISQKQLEAGADLRVRVFAKCRSEPRQRDANVRLQRQPLPFSNGRLDHLLAVATAVEPIRRNDYPVFVTENVLEQAHDIVWQRNNERGVWLAGHLYRQTEPQPEIFCLIHTLFEARGTTHERFSIDFTTETFTHAQQQLSLRQRRLGHPQDLLLGFYHTHPFLPSILDGKEACPGCPHRADCTLTSSFFSQRDRLFHNAMFGAAPYAVEFVMGLTPREEFDLKMFSCDGSQFRERGFYLVKDVPDSITTSRNLVR